MSEMTEWYSAKVKPVRIGWYNYRGWLVDGRLYWNGQQWGDWTCGAWFHFAEMFSDEWRGQTCAS